MISEKIYGCGYRQILRREYELPDGRRELFDIKKEGHSVCILALTPEKQVIISRQYRPGPGKIVFDLPGGAIDPGETPRGAAERELREETGYSGRLLKIGTCLECAYSTKVRHNFVALDCTSVGEATPDDNEFLETKLMPLPEFRALLRTGQLTVVESGYLALDALDLL